MAERKKACLIFVSSMAAEKDRVLLLLDHSGHSVCVVEAKIDDARDAKSGKEIVPDTLQACIDGAEICIFLIPEDASALGELGGGIGLGNASGKRTIGILCGHPAALPQGVDDLVDSVVGIDSAKLPDAIAGEDVWEDPENPQQKSRKAKRVKCQ